ncbi:hypothetical protein GW915_00675 [bacterium]|nr:hypothetical protein [bacterium]
MDNDQTILRQINKEVYDFKNKQISIVPGLFFNQRDMLERIYFFYNSKFTTGDVDDDGDRKYFLNINKNPCKIFTKAVDFDTKNIRMLTAGGGDPTKTWFMERDLKYWMRKQQFGKVLNRIFMELPIFGSVVLKVVKGVPYFVDLRNFIVSQSAENLDKSNYIIEIHHLTPQEFRATAKIMNWKEEKVDEVIEKYHQMKGMSHIRLYERYGEVESISPEGKKRYPYQRVFIADVGVDEYDQYGELRVQHPGVQMSAEDWEGHPYWEFHAEKMSGRWLGIGVVETLVEPQIRQNELANLQAKASTWAALRIFQSRDSGLNRNLLTDTRNGEILNVDSEITQIDMSDRNLAYFNDEFRKWMLNRDEMTFSTDAIQGERSPAGTPLGSVQIAIGQTLTHFERIQEDIAMTVKELLYEVILPQFEKDNTAEHTLRLVGHDLETYISLVKNELVLKELIRQISSNLPFPTKQDLEITTAAIEEAIKQNKEKIITIPKGFYANTKYDVDIDITGESVDTRVRYATKFAILQAITADPTMTTDPMKRKFLYSMAEDGGVNLNDLMEVQTSSPEGQMNSQAPQTGAGGGVSAPQMNAQMAGVSNSTV